MVPDARQSDAKAQISTASTAAPPDTELAPLHPLRLAGASGESECADIAGTGAPSQPDALPRPLHCEWAWRPQPWSAAIHPDQTDAAADATAIGESVSLHHDGHRAPVGFSQHRQPDNPARHSLRIEAPDFDGSFVSLAIALPQSARDILRQRHLLGLWLTVTAPDTARLSARLNILFGPNSAQMLRDIPCELRAPGGALIEFDLACRPFQEDLLSHLWCDIILSAPVPESLTFHDVAFTLRPRAEI